jgi:hypothetical protein
MSRPLLDEILARVAALEVEAREVLSGHEEAPERVITLEKSYDDLAKLSIDQDELFREALRAVEAGLYRAAHVLAWAGFIDFLHNHLWDHYETPLTGARPKWPMSSAEDLRDHTDYGVIEAGRDAAAYNKTVMKALHGLLAKRNECAHPSDFYPDLNEALGYLGELSKRIDFLQKKIAP